MMSLFKEKRRIINVDETWLSETNFSRRKWCAVGSSNSIHKSEISPRIAMLTALDTEGRVYFCLCHANTNTQIMLIFLSRLCRLLDGESWGWRDNTVFLFDWASYHTSPETRKVMGYLDNTYFDNLEVMFNQCPNHTAESLTFEQIQYRIKFILDFMINWKFHSSLILFFR